MDQHEWLEWRRQGIGASDAAAILNISPWVSRLQLWKEKVLGIQQKDNPFMARGRALEDEALGCFMMETGFFLDSQVQKVHPEREWMRATLDGWNEQDRILVEVKVKALDDEIPKHYYAQVQHQMEVVGVPSMFYYSYDGNRGKILKIDKNPSFIETLIEEEERFWEWVQRGCLDLKDDEEFNHHLEQIEAIKAARKNLSEQESFHLSQLILFSDGCPAVGKGGALLQAERKGTIDYKKIIVDLEQKWMELREIYPDIELPLIDTESYRKPSSTYWKVGSEN